MKIIVEVDKGDSASKELLRRAGYKPYTELGPEEMEIIDMELAFDADTFPGLRPNVLAGIREVFARFPEIEKVYLYGSRARCTHKVGSDIDLAISGQNLTFKHQISVGVALDNLEFLETFDVVILNDTLSEAFSNRIEKEGVEVFGQKVKAVVLLR